MVNKEGTIEGLPTNYPTQTLMRRPHIEDKENLTPRDVVAGDTAMAGAPGPRPRQGQAPRQTQAPTCTEGVDSHS